MVCVQVHPPPLADPIEALIQEWFRLVDDDCSGALDKKELSAALRAADIPCNETSLNEMLDLMDFNRDNLVRALRDFLFDVMGTRGEGTLPISQRALPSTPDPVLQIDWDEFHTFISYEVHSGQDIITSDIQLPSGLCLPLGHMIKLLRRKKVISEIEKVGHQGRAVGGSSVSGSCSQSREAARTCRALTS